MFQRAARVGALEEEIERLALESQKLKLEALSEKKLADKARAQALEAGKSLRDARASIDDALVQKVAVATSALRAELATLQGDHDMLASAVATLTEERDAARGPQRVPELPRQGRRQRDDAEHGGCQGVDHRQQ